jgi:hypothetical protein
MYVLAPRYTKTFQTYISWTWSAMKGAKRDETKFSEHAMHMPKVSIAQQRFCDFIILCQLSWTRLWEYVPLCRICFLERTYMVSTLHVGDLILLVLHGYINLLKLLIGGTAHYMFHYLWIITWLKAMHVCMARS